MKPKNKLQERVLALSRSLPPITNTQKEYGEKHCFESYYYRTKKQTVCFDCGHSWATTDNAEEQITCKGCNASLMPRSNRARKVNDSAYYSIVTTYKGFQLIRHCLVRKNCKVNERAEYSTLEVSQTWIEPKTHKETFIAKQVNAFSYGCYDNWITHSEMEIKPRHARHIINPWRIYPRVRVIDEIKRNGFKGQFHDITPLVLFEHLLTQPKFETLYKAGQVNIAINYNEQRVTNVWPSIKIAIRNNYIIKDFSMWYDHIEMLKELGRDILNPKYVCPIDLEVEHARLNAKIIVKREREEQERTMKQLLKNKAKLEQMQRDYSKRVKKFFDLKLVSGEIEIVTLFDIDDFVKEGAVMHHCVFTNSYYEKKNSLILSARMGEQRLETIEIDLENMKVAQCRGKFNQNTPYHDTILNTITNNLSLIEKIKRRRKTESTHTI